MCAEFESDSPPCARCGSDQHGSQGCQKLERAFRDFERWVIGSKMLPEESPGTRGAPSRSEKGSGLPDRLRIVRSIITGAGFTDSPVEAPAILRLWKQDPAGGCTFMLSTDRLTDGERESLANLCGDLGTGVTVELRLNRSIPN